MELGLKGRNALVTGGSQGVGFAVANALAEEGCHVAIGARGAEALEIAKEQLAGHGTRVVTVITDFSSEQGCKAFVDRAAEELGGVDILVNNVGGMMPGNIESITPEQWRSLTDINLLSYVHTTRHAIAHLKKSASGRILNISGMSGQMAIPGALSTTLPNAAINGFSKMMAVELGPHGITVNNLSPGLVTTENWKKRAENMARLRGSTVEQVFESFAANTMLGRSAAPEEVGWAAAFLVSDRAAFITGATLNIDGGLGKHY